jgi:N-acetylglucosaminyldiphosphoundecaprenol N-acetyl-beta-D-mannosaminyltransferase
VRVYFFGGPAGAAQAAAERVNQRAGRMHCVGWCSPGFVSVDDLSTPTYLDPINRSQADFVVVALGAAKGQAWIMRNQALLDAPVLSHLGAVVNFTAGSIHRAPHWMQRTGLEWCWRIAQEPALWRRYWRDGWALAGALVRGSLAWLEARWRNPRRNTSCGSPSVLVRDSTGWQYTSGAIPGEPDNLAMLRAALKNAATDGCGLTVHLSNTRHTSAAELALLQLAQARLHGLTITVATRSQCKRMTASGLNVCTRNATN